MSQQLTPRQTSFVKNIAEGYKQRDAAILAGYERKSVDTQASRMLRNEKIIKALDELGLTDRYIAKNLKQHIDDGLGIKPTADTSLRALDLATKLKGYQQAEAKTDNTLNQTNIYVNELKVMDDTALQARLDTLLHEVESLK